MKQISTLWAEFKAFAFKGNMIDLAVAVVIGAAFSGVINSLVKDIIMPTISYATTAVKDARSAAVTAADRFTQPASGPATQPASQTAAGGAADVDPALAATQPVAATRPATTADKAIAASTQPVSKEWKEMVSAFSTALELRAAADKKAADEAQAEADRKAADEKPVDFAWKLGRLNIGNFFASLLNFIIIAFAVFIIIVKLLGGVMKRAGGTPAPQEPTTKECPECLSIIPVKARRCPNCTSQLPSNATPTT